MINIGIDKNLALVYEGDSNYGRGLWPTPVITPAKFVYSTDEDLKACSSSDHFGYRFREDSYDPIARVRRGRFYCAQDSLIQRWKVARHPGSPFDSIAPDIHGFSKNLETFYGNPIWYKYIQGKKELPLVLLGIDDRFTAWTIIGVEAVASGEDLVTLKARNSFGILPRILDGKVPEAFQAKLKETLETFTDEVHRSSPVSVIDRARDVMTHALLAYFNLRGDSAKDLGALAKNLEEDKKYIGANAARIVAQLHARSKPSEQEKRGLRLIREQDSDLAIQCVGTLLCEIGLAEWP